MQPSLWLKDSFQEQMKPQCCKSQCNAAAVGTQNGAVPPELNSPAPSTNQNQGPSPTTLDFHRIITSRSSTTIVVLQVSPSSPSPEPSWFMNPQREAAHRTGGMRRQDRSRLILIPGHGGERERHLPARHGVYGACRRNRRLPSTIAYSRGRQRLKRTCACRAR